MRIVTIVRILRSIVFNVIQDTFYIIPNVFYSALKGFIQIKTKFVRNALIIVPVAYP